MQPVLRVKDVRSAVGNAINVCSDLTRQLDYINRAQERILYKGKWKGTVGTFRFCVPSSACITWPREIETPEAIAVDSTPYDIRSGWYEFAENGYGILDSESNLCRTLVDRGESPTFDDVTGDNKKLAVYADRTEGSGKYVNLQFYDPFGQFVRTQFNGEWIDGEQIAIPSTAGLYNYTSSLVKPGRIWAVKKDRTVGVVRLYQYDTTNGELKPLAYYQPDEEVPVYRQSLIPSLQNGSCEQTKVAVRAKLRFVPAVSAESFLMIGHREALRLACKAIYNEECEKWDDANINWGVCFTLLGDQVAHHEGSGMQASPQFASPALWGGGIMNLQ